MQLWRPLKTQLQCNITITNIAAWSIEFKTNGGHFDT